ncbi:HalOD1 output domain-containing protein [Halomicroarcula sp. GCM10025324]|uniref:HalOD1 output domain-containing protein n=1 Tax=Haloarcula TaxID=2237 RepID=UPI0023E8E6BC|nr:HalOD1 output domain-containing protein [Halomicroarcula sp. ZS-22-S1]
MEYETENNHSPVQAIVTALADAADIDPVDLPPISEHVDPAALNALFDPHDRTTDGDTVLSFQVDPWNVFVRSDGFIRVCDATQRTDLGPVFASIST